MGHSQFEHKPQPADSEERTCWREMLLAVLSGLYPTDQQLEQMLDHLERTS